MAARITSPEVKVITKDGECHVTITLELNINVNQEGMVSAASEIQEVVKKLETKKQEDFAWAIPDFEGIDKIKFGK